MSSKKHISEDALALYAASDLPVWQRARVWAHVSGCEECRARVQSYQADRKRMLAHSDELPPGLDWERMAAEMTANIHVGLAAGECVAPRSRKASRAAWKMTDPGLWAIPWRPAAVVAALLVVVSAAWWLNVPQSDTDALGRVVRGIVHGGRRTVLAPGAMPEEAGPIVEATSAGVQLRENGGALQVSQNGLRPLTVSVSVQGSAIGVQTPVAKLWIQK